MIPVRRFLSIFLPVLLLTDAASVAFSQTANVQKQVTATSAAASLTDAGSIALQRLRQQERVRAALSRLPVKRQATANVAGGSGGIIETIAGSAPFQAPINALKAGLTAPNGIATDTAGNIYLSIPEFRVVLKVDTSSNITVYAGQALGPGPFQQTGDGGPATTATLGMPAGLAFDSNGNLYIADLAFDTVRVVSAATGTISNVAGTPGQYGHTGDGGSALSAELMAPSSVAVDSQGNLYIADNQYLRKVNLQSGVISSLAGGATLSQACDLPVTLSCPGSTLQLWFQSSSALVAGADSLYASILSDSQGTNEGSEEVVTVSYQTGQVQLIAGGGTSGELVIGPAAIGSTLLFPAEIALDSVGNLDIGIDTVVLQLPKGGSALTTLAGTLGDWGYAGDDGPATSALLSTPKGLTISPSGEILVADWTRIRSIHAGSIATVAGDGTFNFYGDGGAGTQAGLSQPKDTALDGKGNLYIADVGNNTVRKVDAVTGTITTIWGTPVYDPYFSFATVAPLLYDIAADDATHLFISSSRGIEQLDLTTGDATIIAAAAGSAGQLSFDGNHTLAVEDYFYLNTIDTLTGQMTSIPSPISELYDGAVIDGSGNIYFSISCAVWVENISTRAFSEVAGGEGNGGCYPASTGNPATETPLFSPGFLHLDGAGHLLIAEADRIDSVDLAAGTITAIGGSGTVGFSGDGGSVNAADFNEANSLNVDPAGNYYIADTGNDRIRRVVLQPAKLTAALSASSTSFTAGENVTFTATFTGLTLGNVPALGTVTFYDGTTALTDPSATFTSTGNAFTVVLNNSALAVGAHSITAQFAGDGNYAAVTSPAVTVTVVAPIPPSFTVTAAPASITVAQGASGTAVFTVTPAGGFNQAVTFACGSGLPTGVSCSFSPASVTPTGTAAVTSTLTVTTTGATTAGLARPAFRPQTRWWLSGGATSLACLLLFGLPSRRRAASRWLAVLLFGLVIGGVMGCGSNGGGGSKTNPDATPPGTYAVKLTASAGTGSGAISDPVSVTLTVTN